ncbi:cannabinoid receptor 1-like [Dendronephthya gigantea]|uniref:cannabinoid receptor 1-like n=1 Tax=Dendronephthya gigantea TaxID=151771 RepID=UPI00106B61A2|nr:cannabinoid receptor 1-like [Dendronephthya gigantea]
MVYEYLQEKFETICQIQGAPTALSFFSTALSIIFFIPNIPGNVLLILAVAIDPHKNLHCPFNHLMGNLALADLIVGVVTIPLSINFHLKEGLGIKVTDFELHIYHMSYFISGTASVLSIASLAVERYLAISNPHTYRNKVTGKRILGTVAGIWIVSLSLPFIYFEVDYITCSFILTNSTVVVSIAITCFTYGMMLYKFKDHNRHLEMAAVSQVNLATSSQPSNSRLHNNAVHWEHAMTKMFLVVMVTLLSCYGPATVLIYTMSFCESCSCNALHWFKDLQFLFIIMTSSVNFFCYAMRSPRFREAFSALFQMLCRRTRQLTMNSEPTHTPSSA